MTSEDEDTQILERALAACTDEYREEADVWTTLETKAQVVITVAGVFLAAAFSFSLTAGISLNIRILLGITLLALLLALICALWVLKGEDFDLPFDGKAALRNAKKLLDPSANRAVEGARYLELVQSLADGYDEVLNRISTINGHKQKRLGYAYFLLKMAAIVATLAGLLELIGH